MRAQHALELQSLNLDKAWSWGTRLEACWPLASPPSTPTSPSASCSITRSVSSTAVSRPDQHGATTGWESTDEGYKATLATHLSDRPRQHHAVRRAQRGAWTPEFETYTRIATVDARRRLAPAGHGADPDRQVQYLDPVVNDWAHIKRPTLCSWRGRQPAGLGGVVQGG